MLDLCDSATAAHNGTSYGVAIDEKAGMATIMSSAPSITKDETPWIMGSPPSGTEHAWIKAHAEKGTKIVLGVEDDGAWWTAADWTTLGYDADAPLSVIAWKPYLIPSV